MVSCEDFKDFVLEQLKFCENKSVFSVRKMFGKYFIAKVKMRYMLNVENMEILSKE